ncbi:MAG: hypothetical protein ACLQDQ_16605 [Myxococcaceae bacterium]
MRCLHLVAPLSCLALLACATSQPAMPAGPPPDWKLASASMSTGNDFQGVGGNGGQISNSIVGRSINGPVASMDVTGGHIRGTGNSGRSVDVTIKGNKAEGLVGQIPFSAIIDINPDGSAHIVGAMGIGNSDWILSPKVINGRIGAATYNLQWSGTKYEGQMVPSGYAFVQLPAVMATWSDYEVCTVLSLLLMGA